MLGLRDGHRIYKLLIPDLMILIGEWDGNDISGKTGKQATLK